MLRLKKITKNYKVAGGEIQVLKGLDIAFRKSEFVSILGQSGCGKTTILSLLVRNYDIQKGQILVDGIDIKKIKISSLRKHFGQMLQDVFIFSGTIKSNIVLRNYQEPCANALKKYVNGIFVLPPGLGKTQIGLHCASILGQKTLWLTHTKELLQQAKERCKLSSLGR